MSECISPLRAYIISREYQWGLSTQRIGRLRTTVPEVWPLIKYNIAPAGRAQHYVLGFQE